MHSNDPLTGTIRLLREIARVGSIDFQERECLHGTRDQYILLDELIDTAITRAENEATHAVISRKWTPAERTALLNFSQVASLLFRQIPWANPDVTLKEIVENNTSMHGIRDCANELLRHLGVVFTLEELLQAD